MTPRISIDHHREDPESGVRCPACGSPKSSIVNGRPGTFGNLGVNVRRRKCASCSTRFATVEFHQTQLSELFSVVTAQVKATLQRKLKDLQSDILGSL